MVYFRISTNRKYPMPAYWLTFRPAEEAPDRGRPLAELRDLIARVNADLDTTAWWRIHSHQQARVGDRVYVFKQGTASPRGLIGVGEIVTAPDFRGTPTDPEPRWRADIGFQKLVDPTQEFLLSLFAIEDVVPASLVAAAASGFSVPDDVALELERRLAPVLLAGQPAPDSGQADDPAFDPASALDERERALRAICMRRGQPAFRAALLNAYDGRCAITGCDVSDVLEAAHISPYGGPSTDRVSNGLLLRADIHTLFDCGLLAFDPKTLRVAIAGKLKVSAYSSLEGGSLRPPRNPAHWPSSLSLAQRFGIFKATS
jgi:putative restriction endonuclease